MASVQRPLLRDAVEFDVAIAETEAAREAAFRLRYQVYCLERGYEASQTGREQDRFDARSEQATLTQRSTGRVVGTVRLVLPSPEPREPDFPMQHLCGSAMLARLPREGAAEVSRFALSKELRDRDSAGHVPLRLGLVRGAVLLSARLGVTHWCALMEPTLLRLLRLSGIRFEPLGPAVEHRGIRQPCWAAVSDLLDGVRRERPAVWDYLTEGGAVRLDKAELAEVA